MKLKVECPGCKHKFEVLNALRKEEKRKWFQFSASQSFCPQCNAPFKVDLSKLGRLSLLCSVLVSMSLAYLDLYFANWGLMLVCSIILMQQPGKFFKAVSV